MSPLELAALALVDAAGTPAIDLEPFVTLGTAVITGLMGLLALWLKARLDRIDRTNPDLEPGFKWLVSEIQGIRADVSEVADTTAQTAERVTHNTRRIDALAAWLSYVEEKNQ